MARAATNSDVFNAVAEPQRRAILSLIAGKAKSVNAIVEALDLPQPSVSKHLRVLREVQLVEARRDGRQMLYRANAEALRPVHEWAATFEQYWTSQLHRIKARAEQRANSAKPNEEST